MLSKWEPRSRLGVCLGHSPCHAGSVAFVLNPKTLQVSPQFHVVIDNNFSTVPLLSSDDVPPNWKEMVDASEISTAQDYDLVKIWDESQQDTTTFQPDQEGDAMQGQIDLHSSRTMNEKQLNTVRNVKDKNTDIPIQPKLLDLNQLSRRKLLGAKNPSEKAQSMMDKTI